MLGRNVFLDGASLQTYVACKFTRYCDYWPLDGGSVSNNVNSLVPAMDFFLAEK